MDATEPIPVIPLEYAKPAALLVVRRRRWILAAQVALVLAAIDVLVGWLLIWLVDAETVLATAPALLLLGLILMLASWRVRVMITGMLGLAHCSICLLFTMLVNVLNWGPRDAQQPFAIMAGVYLFGVVVPVSYTGWRRLRAMGVAVRDAVG